MARRLVSDASRRNRGRCGARVADSQLCPSARRAWMNPLGLAGGLARRVPGAQLGGGRPGCGPSCTPEDPETPLVDPGGGVGASSTRSRGSVARVIHTEPWIGGARHARGGADLSPRVIATARRARDQGSGIRVQGARAMTSAGARAMTSAGAPGDDERGGAGDDERGSAGDDKRGRAPTMTSAGAPVCWGSARQSPRARTYLSDRPHSTGIERGSARACTPGPTPPGRAGGLWPDPDSLRPSLRTTCRPGSRTAPRCPWSPRPR